MEQELQKTPPPEENIPLLVEVINNELIKHNVTEALITSLHERFMPLKIDGIHDKENYLIVVDARKECKKWRILAKKVCEDGREEAVSIQRAWVAKEKDITKRIGEVEEYLEKQEKEYEKAVAKDKEERRRKQEEQLILRQQELTGMGVLYAEGEFTLGDVSYELSAIKECESDIWEEVILPKYKSAYETIEAERIEQERIKKEQDEARQREQEEIERKKKELEQREAALKKAEEERLQKEKEEQEQKEAEQKASAKKRFDARCNELMALGMMVMSNGTFKYEEIDVNEWFIKHADEYGWGIMLNEIKPKIEQKKAEVENKRLAEIEAQKEAERIKSLGISRIGMIKKYVPDTNLTIQEAGIWTSEEWGTTLEQIQTEYEIEQKKKWEAEQIEKRKAEEQRKQQEMEQAKEKDKWNDIMMQIDSIQLYEFKSGQYSGKLKLLKQKLAEIKAL